MRLRHLIAGAALLSVSSSGLADSPYVAGRFALEIDGQTAGWVESVEGGGRASETAKTDSTPFRFAIGPSSSIEMHAWLEAAQAGSMDGATKKKTLTVDSKTGKRRIDMTGCLIKELSLPKLDASSKAAATFTVTIVPKTIALSKKENSKGGGIAKQAKQWHANNFKFELGGLPVKRVTKIDSFSIKQKVADGPLNAPGDIVVVLPSADEKALVGKLGGKAEVNGELSLLLDDGSVWTRVSLKGVTLKSKGAAGKERRVTLNAKSALVH